jgi:hypothetical protein
MAILKLQQGKQSGDRSPTTNIIGKIFKGAPKNNGKVGKNLDYFRFVAKGRSAERVQELWDQFYGTLNGGEPREITISFPYNNIEWILNEWFCEFGKSGLKTKCNGSQIVEWRDEKNVFQTDKPKPCRAPNSAKGCDACKASDLLKFKIFELEGFGYDGIVELSTTSIHDISYLRDRLTEIQQTLATINLPLRGTPLVLYRETRTITKTINGVSSRSEESLLGLSLHPMLQKKLNQALERRLYAIVDAVGNASLPLGTVEHQVLGSAEPRPAIAPAPEPQEPTVKEAFMAELLALEIEPSEHGAAIGKELWKMGYKGEKRDKGNANLIPVEEVKNVAKAIATSIKFSKLPQKLSDEDLSKVFPSNPDAIATPVPDPINGDDEWETVDAEIAPEPTI